MKEVIKTKTIYKERSYFTLIDFSKEYLQILSNRDISIGLLHLIAEKDPKMKFYLIIEAFIVKLSYEYDTLVFNLN